MANKILLSTFQLSVKDRKLRTDQLLTHFNGKDDILPVLVDFFNDLYTNKRKQTVGEDKTTHHFTIKGVPEIDYDKRIIYGFIDSGIGSESSTLRDVTTNNDLLELNPDQHALFKDLFFYCKIPSRSTRGFLILERRSGFGVKIALWTLLKKWFRQLGYMQSDIILSNVINGEVFNNMLKRGNLKKIEFVRLQIPETRDAFFRRGNEAKQIKGTLKTSISSQTSLAEDWKDFASQIFNNRTRKSTFEFSDEIHDYDEI